MMTQKIHYKIVAIVLVLVLMPNLFYASQVSAQTTFDQSVNVAVIDSLGIINGGVFPTNTSSSTGSFTDFNFYMLSVGNISSVSLGPSGVCGSAGCDTVLLNVASSGMACNVNNLSAQQKTDLVNFVGNGYKLIIYDSECNPQDYSWLPYTFTTANPGAQGAQGTLTIVEENTLSSNDPASPYYINSAMLGSQTDAVGDMNVMTTFDPNWFLDMSGTNILGVTGPVHTYAKFPSGADYGLIIYNGLDVDYMTSSTAPDSSTPGGNLAKIWLQELQQPFNPSGLPGGVPVVGIALTPVSATLPMGQSHSVTATLTDLLGTPQPGIHVDFIIDSGPNAGSTGTCSANSDCTTDANGQISFTYAGTGGAGTDQIKGCFNNQANQSVCSQTVTVEWTMVTQSLDYFALGDSIASGHGLQDEGGNCRRSRFAYPALVNKELLKRYADVKFHHLACTGATAAEPDAGTLTLDPNKWLHNQVLTVLEEAASLPADHPILVSITIGANDFDWASPDNFQQQLYWNKEVQFQRWLDRVVGRVETSLTDEVQSLLAVPNITVIITEVYNPFNRESVFFKYNPIRDRCGPLFVTCYNRTEKAANQLNTAILNMWLNLGRPERLQITAIYASFSSHSSPRASCGSAGPGVSGTWIQYKDDQTSNSFPNIPRRVAPGPWRGDCFHPNIFGAEFIAEQVNADAIRLGR